MENLSVEDKKVFADRKRTNILKVIEQPTLVFLCKLMPPWVTPDMLTAIGMVGTGTVLIGFLLAKFQHNRIFLAVAIFGFALNWFGDSLDGRIAYFREIPRKWYGFALDSIMDWLSLVIMGIGYFYYITEEFRILVFTFCCAYAWSVVIAHIRYKITNQYTIDTGILGPTEVRVVICLVILGEMIFGGSGTWTVFTVFSVVVNVILIGTNIIDTFKLIQLGDAKDKHDRLSRESNRA
jgi:hypothetical protein